MLIEIVNEKDDKLELTTKDSKDLFPGSSQNVLIEAIEIKPPRKRTHSVVETIKEDFFENLKDTK